MVTSVFRKTNVWVFHYYSENGMIYPETLGNFPQKWGKMCPMWVWFLIHSSWCHRSVSILFVFQSMVFLYIHHLKYIFLFNSNIYGLLIGRSKFKINQYTIDMLTAQSYFLKVTWSLVLRITRSAVLYLIELYINWILSRHFASPI